MLQLTSAEDPAFYTMDPAITGASYPSPRACPHQSPGSALAACQASSSMRPQQPTYSNVHTCGARPAVHLQAANLACHYRCCSHGNAH